ncbi:hypothetical protein CFK37_15905 [Virgibacillus phasianinus]|uniref:Uncharacterized protein n=1 Tax=Virgibacillus phasianinus TaxID=2017483 RepID=A0A220U6C6_9BACI|nr:hypothetical protein [Virgibacillus phasianinus]ASK63532.1 hypothetical protein CFK37_15905 [Virgibacillus phasianinus]
MRRPVYKETYCKNNQQNNSSSNWFDRGLLVGILTTLGYFVAYSYQKGFLSYFGVEEVFLSQLTISNVILSISVVGSGAFFAFGAYNNLELMFKQFPVSHNPVWLMFNRAILPLFLATLFFIGFTKYWILYLLLVSLILFYIFVCPIFRYWEIKGYKNKLGARIEELEETGFNKEKILFRWNNILSFKIIVLVIFF